MTELLLKKLAQGHSLISLSLPALVDLSLRLRSGYLGDLAISKFEKWPDHRSVTFDLVRKLGKVQATAQSDETQSKVLSVLESMVPELKAIGMAEVALGIMDYPDSEFKTKLLSKLAE